jgi:hypothetical protein
VNLGFTYGTGVVTIDDGGIWRTQYLAGDYDWYAENAGTPYHTVYGYLYSSNSTLPRTWTADYFVP